MSNPPVRGAPPRPRRSDAAANVLELLLFVLGPWYVLLLAGRLGAWLATG
jgi:hypothetical protein